MAATLIRIASIDAHQNPSEIQGDSVSAYHAANLQISAV